MNKEKTENEWRENTTDHRQWHERGRGPTIKRMMSPADIEYFRRVLVSSYNCHNDELSYTFDVIRDVDDEDKDNFIILTYKLKCVVHSIPQIRTVFQFKVPIPENVKRDYEQIHSQRQITGK